MGWMSLVTGIINKHTFWYENKTTTEKKDPTHFSGNGRNFA